MELLLIIVVVVVPFATVIVVVVVVVIIVLAFSTPITSTIVLLLLRLVCGLLWPVHATTTTAIVLVWLMLMLRLLSIVIVAAMEGRLDDLLNLPVIVTALWMAWFLALERLLRSILVFCAKVDEITGWLSRCRLSFALSRWLRFLLLPEGDVCFSPLLITDLFRCLRGGRLGASSERDLN